jgi:hypothetical protein
MADHRDRARPDHECRPVRARRLAKLAPRLSPIGRSAQERAGCGPALAWCVGLFAADRPHAAPVIPRMGSRKGRASDVILVPHAQAAAAQRQPAAACWPGSAAPGGGGGERGGGRPD